MSVFDKFEYKISKPHMYAIDSSCISSVGYDQNRSELYVQFVAGDTYIYEDIPIKFFGELLSANSAGRYLKTKLINGKKRRQK